MIPQIIAGILTVTALLFMFLGIMGIFRFQDFYSRILIASKVETVGFLTIMAGVIVYSGLSYFSLKVLFICFIVLLTNPLSTHAIARSAYNSGYKIKKENQ